MHLLLAALFLIPLLTVNAAEVVVSTITESAAAQPTSSSYTSDQQFQNYVLAATNFYRMEHGVAAVSWNATSATFAGKWAGGCEFKHSGGPTGENLAAGYANASAAVDAWGLERLEYNFNDPGFSEKTGHFTQLVWSNTTSIGCARISCNGKDSTPGYYVVCEYYPAGNIVGDNNQYFKDNVKKQVVGKSTDTWESGVDGKGGSTTATAGTTTTGSTSTATATASSDASGVRIIASRWVIEIGMTFWIAVGVFFVIV